MKCRFCDVTLAVLRTLADGEFCSDEHRRLHLREQALASLSNANRLAGLLAAPAAVSLVEPSQPGAVVYPIPSPALVPVYPRPPVEMWRPADSTSPERRRRGRLGAASRGIAASWRSLAAMWTDVPLNLKLLTAALPVLLLLAAGPSLPRLRVASASGSDRRLQRAMTERWGAIGRNIVNRAGVEYADDFRSGLDEWQGRSNLTANWSYDAAGFVRPGALALFHPTAGMTDYRFEFLGEIDQKALGCAFRAADLENYYAVKFVVAKPGPLPVVKLVRYAVVDGREGPRVERPLPLAARNDMLYRVLIDVRNRDFTIMAQGQVVDFWSDGRFGKGGVGLFCGRGEKARVRWVEVSHQYDALGKLCAYLAPYGGQGGNGNWN